ncbi:uncharacterized protein LOC135843450 isoform X2 [Planococcus citri]|uniref:uncharacterized protein LOC135843450 isoform X2 n=1 Tax=Planococcus citri TaxID=170843 RepID=UPI0031F8F763
MIRLFSTRFLLYFLFVIFFTGFNYNCIQCFHLRASPNVPEDHYRARVVIPAPGSTENDQESDIIWLNPGVLSNLEEFFDNLSSNMDSIDEEKAVVNEIEADQPLKIKSPLAENYFRGYKPSYKIRNYVQSPDLGLLKGTNHHDPSLKWSGLGKRARF